MTNKGKKPRLVAENRYPKTGAAKKSAKNKTATKRKRRPPRKSAETYLHDLFLGSFVLLLRFCGVFFGAVPWPSQLCWPLALATTCRI